MLLSLAPTITEAHHELHTFTHDGIIGIRELTGTGANTGLIVSELVYRCTCIIVIDSVPPVFDMNALLYSGDVSRWFGGIDIVVLGAITAYDKSSASHRICTEVARTDRFQSLTKCPIDERRMFLVNPILVPWNWSSLMHAKLMAGHMKGYSAEDSA
jgi:hypothetical protein